MYSSRSFLILFCLTVQILLIVRQLSYSHHFKQKAAAQNYNCLTSYSDPFRMHWQYLDPAE